MRSIVPFCLCLIFVSLAACTSTPPTQTPDIPATVTAQVEEHLATIPTASPLPTYTPNPTYTPQPTTTPVPTPAAKPTYTPAPTYTPVPTATPTPTPRPTRTPWPTPTPTETYKWGVENMPVEVRDLYADPDIYARSRKLILKACYTGVDIEGSSIFSQRGGFSSETKFVAVSGVTTTNLSKGDCFLMGVRNVGRETYCYWTDFGNVRWPSSLGCPSHGWKSLTLKFRINPIGAFEETSRY